jgi:hypothetical protein
MPITLENLEEVFTFHKWTPEQVEKGNAIRAAAKELAKAIILSAPPPIDEDGYDLDMLRLAVRRRQDALEMVSETVMKANSAITFEAAELEPSASA